MQKQIIKPLANIYLWLLILQIHVRMIFSKLDNSVLSPGLQSSRSSHCIAGVKFIENNQSTTLFYFKTKHTFLQ